MADAADNKAPKSSSRNSSGKVTVVLVSDGGGGSSGGSSTSFTTSFKFVRLPPNADASSLFGRQIAIVVPAHGDFNCPCLQCQAALLVQNVQRCRLGLQLTDVRSNSSQ